MEAPNKRLMFAVISGIYMDLMPPRNQSLPQAHHIPEIVNENVSSAGISVA